MVQKSRLLVCEQCVSLFCKARLSRGSKTTNSFDGNYTVFKHIIVAAFCVMMVEILRGAARCDRVLVSRRIVLPKIEEAAEGMCLMVLNCAGKQAHQTLEALIEEGIIKEGTFKEIYNNIYTVEQFADTYCASTSFSVTIKDQQIRVYFQEPSEIHENHYGRCTPDGFACGIHDTDVWHKLLKGQTSTNEFVLTRSYHMDCEPDWTCDHLPVALSPEQQNMLELGLPLSFGHAKTFSRLSDEAIVAELDSQMVEKDYDKELADLSSSTERMSLSRSSRPESMELIVRDEACGSPTLLTDAITAAQVPIPGSLKFDEFKEYWSTNWQQIVEEEWRQRYGEYMTHPTTTELGVAGQSRDDGVGLDTDENKLSSTDNYNLYSGEWEKLWVQLATDLYYALMNKLVPQEELRGLGTNAQYMLTKSNEGYMEKRNSETSSARFDTNEQNISMDSKAGPIKQGTIGSGTDEQNISMISQGDSETGVQGSRKEEGKTSSNKRPLSLSDFGVSMSEGFCSIQQRFVKNHKLKKIKKESHNHEKDPNGISADALEDAPKDARIAKYWGQRYRLFRKFDDGIQMDYEGWFSVTPEKIAEHIANRLCPRGRRKSMLTMDGFCGVGGNTIQLAVRSPIVLAVDIDVNRIAMAKNNAKVYGVDRKVEFVVANMEHFVPRVAPDAIFMSPPWGGPEYKNKGTFKLDDMCVKFREIFRVYQALSPNLAFIVPRNTNLEQLCELGRVEVEQNLLNKKIKTITAYYGNLICK
ncbi:uncharacterized protein LOC111255234 isoform X2 [Varroa destructor]|uniref:Trimethylguanosine synthase n=1 Tax=Varroa destructor TaxID=109461 RepID=A0A7M7KYH6_VARDE|nr:uncharacterized protein LOC111255234 isoform X2 [Varroa destructor]